MLGGLLRADGRAALRAGRRRSVTRDHSASAYVVALPLESAAERICGDCTLPNAVRNRVVKPAERDGVVTAVHPAVQPIV